MEMTWLFSTVILLRSLWTCMAIRCLECTDIPTPGTCGKVEQCSANSSCLVREYITTSGVPLFTSGCISQSRCSNTHRREFQEPEADLDISLECCNDMDYCNIEGCGTKKTDLSQRGPYCFDCGVESIGLGCKNIRQCERGQTCTIRPSNVPGHYATGCIPDELCSTVPAIVGRSARTMGPSLYCCKTDFCNDIRLVGPIQLDGDWSAWSGWGTCTLTCGNGTETRTRTCDNPAPLYNGTDCAGSGSEQTSCNIQDCPIRCMGQGYTLDNYSRLCYKFHLTEMSYLNARAVCEKENATVAIIDTAAKWTVVKAKLDEIHTHASVYIGGTEIGERHVFQWPDGARVNFSDWDQHQPNGGDCILLGDRAPWKWRDKDCKCHHGFICTVSLQD